MKSLLFFLLLLGVASLRAQMVVVQSVDAHHYPKVSAKVFAFDANALPIVLQSTKDKISETAGGSTYIPSNLTLSCQLSTDNKPVSAVLAFDVSTPASLPIVQTGARTWLRSMDFGNSECALMLFSQRPYVVQDFTSDSNRLLKNIPSFPSLQGSNHTQAFVGEFSGALPLVEQGRFQRMVVMVSDGASPLNDVLILENARRINAVIHVVMLGVPASPQLRSLARQSGGLCVENVQNAAEAEYVFRLLAAVARGAEPCVFTWESASKVCDPLRIATFDIQSIDKSTSVSYSIPDSLSRRLMMMPSVIKLGHIPANSTKDTVISVTARTAPGDSVHISHIQIDDNNAGVFTIIDVQQPQPFDLSNDSTIKIHIRYTPKDSLRRIGRLLIESDACNEPIAYIEGDTVDNPDIVPRLIFPHGGATLVAGMDTLIRWQNGMPTDTMQVWFSRNSGRDSLLLSDKATDFRLRWQVPDIAVNTGGLLYIAPLHDTILTSGELFTIIKPALTFGLWDLGPVDVGAQKEVFFPNAFTHDAATGFNVLRIDSLQFESPEFSYVSGLPINLRPGESAGIELRFTPSKDGVLRSRCRVYTNRGAIWADIQGEGMLARLVVRRTIDMGTVALGDRRDTILNDAVCLGAATSMRLAQATMNFPDTQQFGVKEFLPVELNASNICTPLRLHFSPQFRGRSCARLLVRSDKNEVYELTLTGTGICGLPTPDMKMAMPDSVKAITGDTIRIPLRLANTPSTFLAMQRGYDLQIDFNQSVLYPLAPLPLGITTKEQRIIHLSSQGFGKGDTLLFLPFITAMGNADSAVVNIRSFHWTDDCSDETPLTHSTVYLQDVCRVGGTRLFLYSDSLAFIAVVPNPATYELRLDFSLRERGQTTLLLLDMFGREVRHLIDEEMDKGGYRLRIPIEDIPTGRYLAVLSTPTKRISTIIGVMR